MATYYWRGGTGSLNATNTGNIASSATAATFTASRATTVLTVTAVASGTISNGDTVWHTSGTNAGTITSFGTGSGGTGTYNMSASGTLTSRTMSSATIGAGPPTSADALIFDVDSNVGTANFTVTTTASAAQVGDFTASGLDGTMTLAISTAPNIFGSWSTPGSNFATSGTGNIIFSATSGTKNITTNGLVSTTNFVFDGVGGTWQLQDDLTTGVTRTVTLTNGALDLNNHTITVGLFASANSNTRSIAFGSTGKFLLGANSGTPISMGTLGNFSFTGTSNFELNYSGSTGTRTVSIGSASGGTEARAVAVNVTAGSDTLAFSNNCTLGSVTLTGFTGQVSTFGVFCYGDLTFDPSTTVAATPGNLTFGKTSGTQTVNLHGVTWPANITLNGAGGTLALGANLTGDITATIFTLTNGTLDYNGHTLNILQFVTATGTKAITWNGGTLKINANGASAFNNAAPTNFSASAGSGAGTISMISGVSKTFVGGGSSFAATLSQDGAGTLTITGSNTFADIANTVQPASVLFTAGTTNTFTAGFSLSGTSGNAITIDSVTAATHTLSKSSGTVSVSNCTIGHSIATGGATWDAFTTNGNVDNGSNTGWLFSGSVTYNDTQTETASAADTTASLAVLADSVSETVAALDTSSSLAVLPSAVAESVSAADTVASGATINDGVTEAVSASDTTASLAVLPSTISESLNATDTTNGLPTGTDEVSESAAASDTTNAVVVFTNTISETASATDTTAAGTTYSSLLHEVAHAVDTVIPGGSFTSEMREVCVAVQDTVAVVRRLKWFLSFAQVDPAPDGLPGGPGKLFGDFRYEDVP